VNLNELGESVIKVAGNKLVKTKVVNLSYLFEETKIINVRTHLVDSDINIIGRTVMRKLEFRLMYTKENSEKKHPKIQEEFYTQEELDEIKKYLP
jgi:predicted aspartyl protease